MRPRLPVDRIPQARFRNLILARHRTHRLPREHPRPRRRHKSIRKARVPRPLAERRKPTLAGSTKILLLRSGYQVIAIAASLHVTLVHDKLARGDGSLRERVRNTMDAVSPTLVRDANDPVARVLVDGSRPDVARTELGSVRGYRTVEVDACP